LSTAIAAVVGFFVPVKAVAAAPRCRWTFEWTKFRHFADDVETCAICYDDKVIEVLVLTDPSEAKRMLANFPNELPFVNWVANAFVRLSPSDKAEARQKLLTDIEKDPHPYSRAVIAAVKIRRP